MSIEIAIQVFDEWRNARMNRHYYGYKLRAWQQVVFWTDLVALITIASVGVGLWLLPIGTTAEWIYKLLALIATACTIFQLLKKPAEIAAALEAHVAVFEQLDNALGTLVRQIKAGQWTVEIHANMEQALSAARSVHLRRVEAFPDNALRSRVFDEVNQEIPPNFFM